MTGKSSPRAPTLWEALLSLFSLVTGTESLNICAMMFGGAYQAATLGVPTILYAPFAFFNWLSPLVTLMFGWFGWTIAPRDLGCKHVRRRPRPTLLQL